MAGPDDRLIATMGLMARDVDNEALIALRQATRMLADRGVRWEDVARIIVQTHPQKDASPRTRPQPAEPRPTPPPPPPEPSASDRRQRRRADHARSYDRARPRRTVKGFDIPERIRGRVVVHEEKRTLGGDEYLIISVDNDEVVWGPLMVFDDQLRSMIHYLSDDWVTLTVEHPSNSMYHPIVTDLQTTG